MHHLRHEILMSCRQKWRLRFKAIFLDLNFARLCEVGSLGGLNMGKSTAESRCSKNRMHDHYSCLRNFWEEKPLHRLSPRRRKYQTSWSAAAEHGTAFANEYIVFNVLLTLYITEMIIINTLASTNKCAIIDTSIIHELFIVQTLKKMKVIFFFHSPLFPKGHDFVTSTALTNLLRITLNM
jgi:hypothetical protein